jgi:hypothetical protein
MKRKLIIISLLLIILLTGCVRRIENTPTPTWTHHVVNIPSATSTVEKKFIPTHTSTNLPYIEPFTNTPLPYIEPPTSTPIPTITIPSYPLPTDLPYVEPYPMGGGREFNPLFPPVILNSYMPIVMTNRYPIFGVQVEGRLTSNHKYLAENSAVLEQIKWYEVEVSPGVYKFPDYLLEDYKYIEDRETLYQIKNAPEWMRVDPSMKCSPPKEEYYDDFAYFLNYVIDYFNITAIEVWNEPNTPPEIIPDGHDYYYGCWGHVGKSYIGGADYGEMLKVIYPIIKSEHPNVEVYAGALSPGDSAEDFVKGFISVGNYFDGISYHAYPHYGGEGYDEIGKWYNILSKYTDNVIVTETSLLNGGNPTTEFEIAQAEYFVWSIDRVKFLGMKYMFWYDLHNTWAHCGLIESNRKKPAWFEYNKILGE